MVQSFELLTAVEVVGESPSSCLLCWKCVSSLDYIHHVSLGVLIPGLVLVVTDDKVNCGFYNMLCVFSPSFASTVL